MMDRFVLYKDHNEIQTNTLLYELLKNPPISKLSFSDFKTFVFYTLPFLQTLSEIVIFLRIFYSIYHTQVIPDGLRLILPFIILCFSTLLLFINRSGQGLNEVCRLMIVVIISIEILQSIIGNLISSVSDDTIYAVSVFLIIIKMASCGKMGNSTISLNSGMIASILLATRLQHSEKVAVMLHSSMIVLASFSWVQKYFTEHHKWTYEYIFTASLTIIALIASIEL
ncbi:hypothetical protein BMR1_03g01658 [Babesia microti strain RI]|uniref:Uncharacterized protein n=1 Tax=Babesia microti (strain RI) TaxID=1133968 RepID=A0A1R4ABG8_BABMR|nr:hypothetical protein BMR1_03g01658 [Babesia microti strain RI]SJK86371.1 hypothetical protein BMR1_03g01658 [Babesia microti strain RI]|eukprot:XP_021338533.1 hypothetical protein BMR1_03g01658 [Babesia microti strain RI]